MKKILLAVILSTSMSIIGCNGVPTVTPSPQSSSSNTAQKDLVTIEGIVMDPSEKTIEGVKIVVKDNSTIIGTTKTDDKGSFSIKVPKTFDNSYYIEASKEVADGSLSQTLIVTSGQKANFVGNDKLVKTVVASKPVPIQ